MDTDFKLNGKNKPQGNIQSSCYPDEWLFTSFADWAETLRMESSKMKMRTSEYLIMVERDKGYWAQT